MKGKLNLKMYGGKCYLKKEHQIINYHTIIADVADGTNTSA